MTPYLAALSALIVGLFAYLLYLIRDSFRRVSRERAERINISDIETPRDSDNRTKAHGFIMDFVEIAKIQNSDSSPSQIYIFAPDPLDLHSEEIYSSTLNWCNRHLRRLGTSAASPSDRVTGSCMVFWCRHSERSPRVLELVRRLYFDVGEDPRIFDLFYCAKLPDYMFFHDMLLHHYDNGTTRAYLNSRLRGVTDVLFELHAPEAVQLANLFRFWLDHSTVSSLAVPDLIAPDMKPDAQSQGKHQSEPHHGIRCYNVNDQTLSQPENAQIIRGMFTRDTAKVYSSP